MKEQLPCTLRLNVKPPNFCKSISYSKLDYNTSNKNKFDSTWNTFNSFQKCNSKQASNIYNTYGKSCGTLNVLPDNQDLMVDIDLDPTYQKILDNFRKAMAHCS